MGWHILMHDAACSIYELSVVLTICFWAKFISILLPNINNTKQVLHLKAQHPNWTCSRTFEPNSCCKHSISIRYSAKQSNPTRKFRRHSTHQTKHKRWGCFRHTPLQLQPPPQIGRYKSKTNQIRGVSSLARRRLCWKVRAFACKTQHHARRRPVDNDGSLFGIARLI